MKTTLIFDLDGTISDPVLGFGRSINFALERHGHQAYPLESLGPFIGPPLESTMSALVGNDPLAIRQMITSYRERYGAIGYSENTLYPGIFEVIQTLHAKGVRMGVCSSKRRDFVANILELFGLSSCFEFVSGGDIGIEKWQQVAALLEEGTISSSSVMVGDRGVDISAAHRNGLRGIGVLWGYGSREELEAERPFMLLESVEALLELESIGLRAV